MVTTRPRTLILLLIIGLILSLALLGLSRLGIAGGPAWLGRLRLLPLGSLCLIMVLAGPLAYRRARGKDDAEDKEGS
jgi:hypothetical protein